MGIFGNVTREELENTKVGHRLEKGRLKKELSTHKAKIEKLESRLESEQHVSEAKISDLEKERDYYKSLENDRDKIEAEKRVIKVEKEDLAEDRKLYNHRTERLKKRETELGEEDNAQYKNGYSDGLADGLRKAHDITREDRKFLTMIAMSTNQSKAIEVSQKAMGEAYKDDSSDSKSQ